MMDCQHPREVLLRLNTGAGGLQFRRYCLTCWRAGPALAHAAVRHAEEVPEADAALIEKARACYWRARHV